MNPYQYAYHLLRFFFWPVLRCLFQFEVRGLEHIKNLQSGAIVAGNHTGYLDSAILLVAYPHAFRFLVREEVLGWPLIGRWVKRGNTLTLYKSNVKSILARVASELKRDEHFCIFPEGCLSRDGSLGVFQEGVAFLQEKAGVPIIPFAIHGGFEAWAEGQKWPRFRKITLSFGKPILPGTESRREITQRLRVQVSDLKSELEAEEMAGHLEPAPCRQSL